MNAWRYLALKVYRVLLAFYPSEFRAEFGQEMQDVLATALTKAQTAGGEPPWRLLWREMCDWPGSVLQEHLRARRCEMVSRGFAEKEPVPRVELLAALILFLLPLFSILATIGTSWHQWIWRGVGIMLFGGAVFVALGFAVVKGLPRWSLSYLGFLLLLGLILSRYDRTWGWIYPFFIRSFGPRSYWPLAIRLVYVAAYALIMLSSLLLSALIVVNLLRVLPHTRGVWQRIRADWTQLSFLLYGGLVLGIRLMFEEYRYHDLWQLTAWACLGLGAWGYLVAKRQKQRILALTGGATAAMWTVAIAKWALVPRQSWLNPYLVSPVQTTRLVEVGSAVTFWACILLVLLAPTLLNLVPRAARPIASSERDPATA